MTFSCCKESSTFCAAALVCAFVVAFFSFIVFIIVGSIAASQYVKDRNIRNLHKNTSCLLLNYSISEHQCETCGQYGCSNYKCFDEHFQVSYPIFNHTRITSVIASFNENKRHVQTVVCSIILI